MITDYSNGASGTLDVNGTSVGYTVSNSNSLSPTSTSAGLTWGSVRTPGQQLLLTFEEEIDEAVIYLADFNTTAEQTSLVLNGVVIDLNDAIADGSVEIISLNANHSINTDGELTGSGLATDISSFRITVPIQSFGIRDTSTETRATQVRFSFEPDPSTYVVCFANGTLLMTPKGDVAVEDLKVGDAVLTMDNGLQRIRWIGTMKCGHLESHRPVVIRKGALGYGQPVHDLHVSRQHRVLIANADFALMFGASEVLVPACKLVGLPGIEFADHSTVQRYFHILFDQHEVLKANGAWSESLLLASQSETVLITRGNIDVVNAGSIQPMQPARPLIDRDYEVALLHYAMGADATPDAA